MTIPILRMFGALCLSVPMLASDPGSALQCFQDPRDWRAAPSEGVELALAQTAGREGPALRMAFDFHGGAGYAAARRPFPRELPANYEISFWVRGDCPSNTFEFKLVDPSGDNVWWVNKRNFQVPSRWTKVVLKKRHFSFAWGPAGGGEAKSIGWLELAITAGKGGKGHIDLDGLAIHELPPAAPYDRIPAVSASASEPTHPPAFAVDGKGDTAWRTAENGGWYQLDFLVPREFGGLVLDWDGDDFATDYEVQVSEEGVAWTTLRKVQGGSGGIRHLALPEAEGRFLRLACTGTSRRRGWGLRTLAVKPLEYSSSPNAFFEAVAKASPRGDYPRGFAGEQNYWTVLGVDGGFDTGLLGEDGTLEAGRGGVSIEPFLWSQGELVRWSDVACEQSLEKNYLPIPTVRWKRGELSLQVTAFGSGPPQAPVIRSRYRVSNSGSGGWQGTLFLALRPFQVNPPQQFLGTPGGVVEIHQLELRGRSVLVNQKTTLLSATRPDGFGAATFDQGSITEFLHRGQLPAARHVADPLGYASGALRYDLDLKPGESREIFIEVPLLSGAEAVQGLPDFNEDLARTLTTWEEKLNRVTFQIPDQAVADTLRTCLAHILISRRGPALQPGTRSYARSWIRDGALIAAGLLRLGHAEEVRAFIEWYAPNLFANGKVPCVVDERGADPVPENDSHGEFIYLVAEYDRFRHDPQLLGKTWPQVQRAWDYLDHLIQTRRTLEFQQGEKRLFYGLVPESISHEGYSAKPQHSYWDDFFTLRGLKDAVDLAGVMKEKDLQLRYSTVRDRFRSDFMASIQGSMEKHHIAYIPGCAELGDFDATSTTIGLSPCGELAALPRAAVENTFETFYQQFLERKQGRGKGDRYTPYETRVIGSFVQLGWTARAHELINFYLGDLRPRKWNQWPEVVQRDFRAPVFLGDLPHAWVGSDFIRSALALFAYEREQDRSLVVGAGLSEDWLRARGGVAVSGLNTPFGEINLRAAAEGERVTYELSGRLEVPAGGIVLRWPLSGGFSKVTMNGQPLGEKPGHEVVVRRLPAKVVMDR